MSDISIQIDLPLDEDGFLRRQCPNCRREFKWLPQALDDDADSQANLGFEQLYCPYCHGTADPSDWFTEAQRDYATVIVNAEIIQPELRKFQRDLRRTNRPDGFIQFDAKLSGIPEPEPLSEPNDMVRADFPCHPEVPLKVDELWDGPVACLVCGIHYPAELVKPLTQPDEDDA